jgi:DNA-binding response OmpR family regulator
MKASNKLKPRRAPIRSLNILLAEDDPEMRKLLAWSLERKGYRVVECRDGTSLMTKLGLLGPADRVEPHDLIISDIRMPGVTGMHVLEYAKEFADFPPIILITAFPDTASREQVTKLGALAMLAKPFDMEELLSRIEDAFPPETLERKQKRRQRVMGGGPSFSLEITFRHNSGSEAVRDYIQSVAAKLHPLAQSVVRGRIVVDQADVGHHKKHRYTVTLLLFTSGSPVVVKYDTDKGATSDDLYFAVNVVFGTALRRLKESIKKRQEHRAQRDKPSQGGQQC